MKVGDMSVNDPKQIVTPYAFEVTPDLLGEPLATPKRRLAAILIDLTIAGLLSALGALALAAVVSIFFFVIALRKKYEQWYKNILKYVYAVTGSFFMFLLAVALIKGTSPEDSSDFSEVRNGTRVVSPSELALITKEAMSTSYGDSAEGAKEWQELARNLEEEIMTSVGQVPNGELEVGSLPEDAPEILHSYAAAIESGDSVRIDSLEPLAAGIAARKELAELRYLRSKDRKIIKDLEERNEELAEIAENPGIYRVMKQLAKDTGLALGWVGLYFIICLAWWEGQTPGKKLLKLKVVRLNGTPLHLWYSFERFGGYAAGFATGLLGFFQVYWDPNRQGIHDKIAGTVVLDLRESKRNKTEELRHKVLDQENLLN